MSASIPPMQKPEESDKDYCRRLREHFKYTESFLWVIVVTGIVGSATLFYLVAVGG